jgi:hypothetical protein
MVIDRRTGELWFQARGGQTYSPEQVREIEERARAGDAAAAAALESLDMTGQLLEEALHDCPECRAAMARGEVPTMVDGDPRDAMPRRATGRMKPVMRRRPYRRHR